MTTRKGPTATSRPSWIQTTDALRALVERLRAGEEIALDTEGDSLHHYPERLALIQLADAGGEAWLIDPLALADLSPLGSLLGATRPRVVLHAGDNDLTHLKRRYGFAFGTIFDTSVAARFLGGTALGLDVLLTQYLGVELPPSRQKDDWSARPLTESQETYAAADVLHLIELKNKLTEELARVGRLAWVEEECAALAAEPAPERVRDPEAWARLKGARDLGPRGLTALRELYELRERLALAADRPPFKILSDATLVALAQAGPDSVAALGPIPGCTPRIIGRWGHAILEAVDRARTMAEDDLPRPTPPRRPPSLPGIVRRRIEALRNWRAEAAPKFGLEPGALLPNRLIRVIAEAAPRDREGLAQVEGVRRWRAEVLGDGILAAIAAA